MRGPVMAAIGPRMPDVVVLGFGAGFGWAGLTVGARGIEPFSMGRAGALGFGAGFRRTCVRTTTVPEEERGFAFGWGFGFGFVAGRSPRLPAVAAI
jgi:hypothetical protein